MVVGRTDGRIVVLVGGGSCKPEIGPAMMIIIMMIMTWPRRSRRDDKRCAQAIQNYATTEEVVRDGNLNLLGQQHLRVCV